MDPAQQMLMSLPLFDSVDERGRYTWQHGNSSVREVMINILLTRPGERLMRPEFGAGILNYIHHPNNETTRALIADAAEKAIKRWETRVDIQEVSILPDPRQLSRLNLSIRYRLRIDGRQEHLELVLDLAHAN